MPPKAPAAKTYEETWKTAQNALEDVNAVLRADESTLQTIATIRECKKKLAWYNDIYKTCTSNMKVADLLYNALRKWLHNDLQKHVTLKAKEIVAENNMDKLFTYVSKSYAQYRQLEKFASFAFGYLDQYLAKKPGYYKVADVFAREYHEAVYQNVKKQLVAGIVKNITIGRNGNRLDRDAIRSCVAIFTSVGTAVYNSEVERAKVFTTDFEDHYIDAISEFYPQRAHERWHQEGGHYSYLSWVEFYWRFEEDLAKDVLKESSMQRVYLKLQEVMLAPYAEECICHPDSGFQVLMQDSKKDELSRMFTLFKRVPNNKSIQTMADEMSKYIVNKGNELRKEFEVSETPDIKSSCKTVVDDCLVLFNGIGDWIEGSFENHQLKQDSRKAAFSQIFRNPLDRKEKKAEKTVVVKIGFEQILAMYIDAVMRNEYKDITDPDEELERVNQLTTLFNHLDEKDMFSEIHREKLGKRLLQTTPNEDLETTLLEKLQRQMGKAYTHKMEGMMKDRSTTQRLSDEFKTDEIAKRMGPMSFVVQILSFGSWPCYAKCGLVPHGGLDVCMDAFKHFYRRKHGNRQLDWIHMLGSGQLNISFSKGKKDVTGNTYQCTILCIVDDAGPSGITVKDITSQMKLDAAKIVKPQIATMYLHKAFPLLCLVNEAGEPQPAGKGIQDTNILAMNKSFNHKTRRFKLPNAVASSKEGVPTDLEKQAQRKCQIEACIVRVMKSRRTLMYLELQDLVIQQLSKLFSPQPKMIKVSVENLITREYLKRDADESAKFHYLA